MRWNRCVHWSLISTILHFRQLSIQRMIEICVLLILHFPSNPWQKRCHTKQINKTKVPEAEIGYFGICRGSLQGWKLEAFRAARRAPYRTLRRVFKGPMDRRKRSQGRQINGSFHGPDPYSFSLPPKADLPFWSSGIKELQSLRWFFRNFRLILYKGLQQLFTC
jgi:hypothetical protein